jgi:hypothetical protein
MNDTQRLKYLRAAASMPTGMSGVLAIHQSSKPVHMTRAGKNRIFRGAL